MTVREIAKLAGVSIGTVDRVLHNRGRVLPETDAKIRAIIDKYHFIPNPIARRLKRNKAYRFCALVPQRNLDSGYWEQVIHGIKSGADEVASLGIETEIIEFNHYDPAAFRRGARQILTREPDGVILAPLFPDIARPFTVSLQKKGIPYTFFDADLPGAKPICAIGQDSFRGGYLAGKLLHLFIGKITGSVAVLYDPRSYHIGRRRDGFLSYSKEQGIKTVIKNYARRDGMVLSNREITGFLKKQENLQGVFVSYADVHQIADAAEARRKKGNFFIVGYDLVPANHKLLMEGRIDAIISQRPQEQSRQALLSLYRYIVLGSSIDPAVEMPLDIYVRENIPDENGLDSPIIDKIKG
ncbi:MAG: LacI family DNA-binding transcriptional regulator [Treponema sp.]|nr:LacI family DNA-binding transcriptional regulator [Treponema sp.]